MSVVLEFGPTKGDVIVSLPIPLCNDDENKLVITGKKDVGFGECIVVIMPDNMGKVKSVTLLPGESGVFKTRSYKDEDNDTINEWVRVCYVSE